MPCRSASRTRRSQQTITKNVAELVFFFFPKGKKGKQNEATNPPVDGVHHVIKVLVVVGGLGDLGHELDKLQ